MKNRPWDTGVEAGARGAGGQAIAVVQVRNDTAWGQSGYGRDGEGRTDWECGLEIEWAGDDIQDGRGVKQPERKKKEKKEKEGKDGRKKGRKEVC